MTTRSAARCLADAALRFSDAPGLRRSADAARRRCAHAAPRLRAAPALRVLAGIALLTGCTNTPPSPAASVEYSNSVYGYSFEYPDSLELHVYSPDHVAVGRETENGFDAALEAGVFLAENSDTMPYEEFVADRARTLCAADSPRTSLRCTDLQQQMPFETQTGLTGEVFYLKHETVEPSSGTITAESGRGPFFAFNISANAPAARHAVLLIRPPTTLEPTQVDSELIRAVANTLRINRTR